MKCVSVSRRQRLWDIASKLDDQQVVLHDASMAYNDAVLAYNELLQSANSLCEEIVSEQEDYYGERNEFWQASPAGLAYLRWTDSYADIDLEEVEEIEVFFGEHDAELVALPIEPKDPSSLLASRTIANPLP